jgi:hypothetical protein
MYVTGVLFIVTPQFSFAHAGKNLVPWPGIEQMRSERTRIERTRIEFYNIDQGSNEQGSNYLRIEPNLT